MEEEQPLNWTRETTEAKAKRRAGDPGWVETSARVADYFLNVLPPIYFPDGFACSEPDHHTDNDEAVYLCFRRVYYHLDTAELSYKTIREARAL